MVLLAFLPSCKEPDPVIPNFSMKDLVVPSGFNYGLTKSVQITVLLPSTVSYSTTHRIIEFWDETATGKPGKLIKRGSADNQGTFAATFTVPVTTKKIFTNCFAGWRSVAINPASSKSLNGTFTIDYNPGYGRTTPASKPAILNVQDLKTPAFAGWIKSGRINKVQNGDFSDPVFGKIEAWSSPIENDSLWYATEEAQNFGSFISEEGNSFARINSVNYSTGGFTQLIRATEGQTVAFSGDARGFDSQQDIYLYLIPRNEIGEPIDAFFFNMVNPGNSWVNGTVVGDMPPGTVSCQILFYKHSTGLVDFDNARVYVNGSNEDSDTDGVLDFEDSYPDQHAQAFNDYYPADNSWATFAFEDSWPFQNDYDFNDLVLDYRINRLTNSGNKVVGVNFISQVRAVGSAIASGFGVQFNISPDLISGIAPDFEFTDDAIKLNPNGTEIGQNRATFIIYNNASKAFTHIQEGSPTINTTLGYYFVVPLVYNFRISFTEPLENESISIEHINPFIFRTAERSREVHLPGFPPTDLANLSLFGTGEDVSVAATGPYYKTVNGVPWGISIPAQLDYPIENTDLVKGQLYFASWASSGGVIYQDWYIDNQGYRNWDVIYRW